MSNWRCFIATILPMFPAKRNEPARLTRAVPEAMYRIVDTTPEARGRAERKAPPWRVLLLLRAIGAQARNARGGAKREFLQASVRQPSGFRERRAGESSWALI